MGLKTTFSWNGTAAALAGELAAREIGVSGFTRLAEQAKSRMEPFIPYDTGALAGSASVSAEQTRGFVTYGVPYAAAVYYGDGVAFKKERHPLATAFWDREAFRR